MLGIENIKQIQRDPLYGALFENLVLMELIKARLNQGRDPQLYYFRDHHGNEVDIIYKQATSLISIEVKASATFNTRFLNGLKYFQNLTKTYNSVGYLVYTGDLVSSSQNIKIINYLQTANIIQDAAEL